MVRRLSRERAEMMLAAGARASWVDRRTSASSDAASSTSPRRLSVGSLFGSGPSTGDGAGGGEGSLHSSRNNGSFGTLELLTTLNLENIAPVAEQEDAASDDDEEMQRRRRVREENAHHGGRQQRREPEEQEGGSQSEGLGTADSPQQAEGTVTATVPACVPAFRSASMGFASSSDVVAPSGGILPVDGSPYGPGYSRTQSEPVRTAAAPIARRSSMPFRAAPNVNSSSLLGPFASETGGGGLLDPRGLRAAYAGVPCPSVRRTASITPDSAWSVVESELEAVGSCSGTWSSSRLDASWDEGRGRSGGGVLGGLIEGLKGSARGVDRARVANVPQELQQQAERNRRISEGSDESSEHSSVGGVGGGRPSTASHTKAVRVKKFQKTYDQGKAHRYHSDKAASGRQQRRRSSVGLFIAGVALIATISAAWVLIQRGGNGGMDSSSTSAGGNDKSQTGAEDESIDANPTRSNTTLSPGGDDTPSGTNEDVSPADGLSSSNLVTAEGGAPPPVPSNFHETCSYVAVSSSQSDFVACRELCKGAECCFLPPTHVLSCAPPFSAEEENDVDGDGGAHWDADSERGGCGAYVRQCGVLDEILDKAEGSSDAVDEGTTVFSVPQNGDNLVSPQDQQAAENLDHLRSKCSTPAVSSASGFSQCWGLCEEALCCFANDEFAPGMAELMKGRSDAPEQERHQRNEDGSVGGSATGSAKEDEQALCRDDCGKFEPCRSLFAESDNGGKSDDPGEDVYVIEEEEGEYMVP